MWCRFRRWWWYQPSLPFPLLLMIVDSQISNSWKHLDVFFDYQHNLSFSSIIIIIITRNRLIFLFCTSLPSSWFREKERNFFVNPSLRELIPLHFYQLNSIRLPSSFSLFSLSNSFVTVSFEKSSSSHIITTLEKMHEEQGRPLNENLKERRCDKCVQRMRG